jgi:hypothetical protein
MAEQRSSRSPLLATALVFAAGLPLACGGAQRPPSKAADRVEAPPPKTEPTRVDPALVERLLGALGQYQVTAPDDGWELGLPDARDWSNAGQGEIAEGDSVYLGLSIALIEGQRVDPEANAVLSALAFRRRGADVKGIGVDLIPRNAHEKIENDAALREVIEVYAGRDDPDYPRDEQALEIPANLDRFLRSLPAKATDAVTPTERGWLVGGEALIDVRHSRTVRQPGTTWLAVKASPGRPAGILFSAYSSAFRAAR